MKTKSKRGEQCDNKGRDQKKEKGKEKREREERIDCVRRMKSTLGNERSEFEIRGLTHKQSKKRKRDIK